MSNDKIPRPIEQAAMDERIDRAAEAFATALLKHPMLLGMIRSHMASWKIPTVVEGNTAAMIDAIALHLHWQRAGVQRMSDADLGRRLREVFTAAIGSSGIVHDPDADRTAGHLARVLLGAGK